MGGSPVPSQTIIGGQKAERPDDPTRAATASESYSFAGWYTSTDEGVTLSTNAFDFNTPITSSITLYAKWTSPGLIPLTFEFIYDGSITITNPWSTLKYSINGGTLNAYTNEITVNARDKVCLFAQNSENTSSKKMNINCSADCYIYGNIMSLVTMDEQDNWNPEESNVCEYAFYYLFYNNEHILNHNEKELYLPATTLAKSCYSGMFGKCTSLTIAPNIAATTVAKACCESMFSGCSSLTTAPFLPATILEEDCYAYMFYNCTSLTIVPSLPATILADYSYRYMFCGCKSLTTTPSIAAISLAKNCCEAMFRGCTSLTEVQSLPATILAECCYREMFMNCTSLTSAPSLPATTLAVGCYISMFNGCTSLTTVPSLPAITLTDNCYSGMFYGCTSLTTAPSLPATTLKSQCYYYMFNGCTSLSQIECLATDISATNCTKNWLSGVSAEGKFIKADGMTDWTEGASGIPSGWTVEDKEP